jgi:anti-sigma factor RsiW
MDEPTEDTLVEFVLGVLPRIQHDEVSTHLGACQVCEQAVEEYREMVAALQVWHEAPAEAATAGSEAILQRIRLHRLLDQLFADVDLRRKVGLNPEGTLVAHGIAPTPQLLAAFKDLGLSSPEQFPGELDERITKFRRWLEWFPGAHPGPLGI